MKRKADLSRPDWSKLLIEAVQQPGVLSAAYQQFWNYSVGNQLLALFECFGRKLPPGPIHTFLGWQQLGRFVKKGEKAITLCMPISVKARNKAGESPAEGAESESREPEARRMVFVYRSRWFVLAQTEGKAYVPTELPEWSELTALEQLRIERVEFDHLDGNCQGFARSRSVAVSPIAFLPHKTLFHELGHVVLGHTEGRQWDDHDQTSVHMREVEAECVALICCESLNLPGATECRGYIQHWLRNDTIPPTSAQQILKAADEILKAGTRSLTLEAR